MGSRQKKQKLSSQEKEKIGRRASIEGFANEKIVCGILMKKYENVSLVDLPLSSYDIIIVRKKNNTKEDIIRVQVKTAKKSISFTGGTRGGVDRTYKSGIKTYIQSPERSDCIVGIHDTGASYELYFIPTILISYLGKKSISLKRIECLKENYEMLENCKNESYVIKKAKEYNLL